MTAQAALILYFSIVFVLGATLSINQRDHSIWLGRFIDTVIVSLILWWGGFWNV